MSTLEERRHMKAVDEMILGASPAELREIQRLDVETQLSGGSFYDACAESKPRAAGGPGKGPGRRRRA